MRIMVIHRGETIAHSIVPPLLAMQLRHLYGGFRGGFPAGEAGFANAIGFVPVATCGLDVEVDRHHQGVSRQAWWVM